MLKKTILLMAAATITFAAPASAHSAWLLPSTTVLSDASQGIAVDAGRSTEPFNPDHAPLGTDDIRVWEPDGTMGEIENSASGRYRSTFDVRIDKLGTWRIGTSDSVVRGTFKVDGETWSVGRRRGGFPPAAGIASPGGAQAGGGRPALAQPPAGEGQPGEGGPRRPQIDPRHVVDSVEDIPAGASDFDLTEMQNRNEFFVTAGAPTDSVLQPLNKGLEMVPVTRPTDLVSNEPGKFRFLVDGKPAAALKVKVIPGGQRYRDAEHAQELTTDTDGVLTVSWPVAGFYWLNANLSDDNPSASKATKRRMSYTATLEVVAP